MPSAWLISLKRSVNCKSELSDVKEPHGNNSTETPPRARNKCLCCSVCSRSASSSRDVSHGHGSKRHRDKAPIDTDSPVSIASTEIVNPINHQTVFTDSKCVLHIKTTGSGSGKGSSTSTFVGTLCPGTPGPGEAAYYTGTRSRGPSNFGCGSGSGSGNSSKHRRSLDLGSQGYACQKCGENFTYLEAIESHHLSRHAVTALCEGDSSKKIVELICQTCFSHSENESGEMERILKIHNVQKTLALFEDYREIVKLKANKLSNKHPRCLADGNELLRFYGTTIACSLGMENTLNLCTQEECGVCQILRYGFFSKKQPNGCWGVFTCSTSKRALDCIEIDEGNHSLRKAMVVCRVIAGRVLKPPESLQGMEAQPNFDSLVGKADCNSNIEELYSLNPRALLPCFVVVICKN